MLKPSKETGMKIEEKGVIPDSIFWVGIGNISIYLIIYFLGCLNSGWTCSGDSMGGIMMVYALTIFIPQFLLFIFLTIYFIRKLTCIFRKEENERPSRRDWRKFIIYSSLSMFAYFIG